MPLQDLSTTLLYGKGPYMPAWLLSALTALRGAAFGTPVRAAVTGAGAGLAVDDLPGVLTSGAIPGLGFPFGGGRPRRRRRRRALTQGDREDLLFLGSMLSKAGVERVAAVLVAR